MMALHTISARASEWGSFQFGWLSASAVVGSSQSGYLAWTPSEGLSQGWSIRGRFGSAWFADSLGGRFLSLDSVLLAEREVIGGCSASAGAGAQTWVSNGGSHILTQAIWVCRVGEGSLPGLKRVGPLDRVYIGYGRVWVPDNAVTQWGLGIGASF